MNAEKELKLLINQPAAIFFSYGYLQSLFKTYTMSPETLKSAKEFKTQTGFCSILIWSGVLFIAFKNPNALAEIAILPIGGIVMSFIYFKMRKQINDYEEMISTKKNDCK